MPVRASADGLVRGHHVDDIITRGAAECTEAFHARSGSKFDCTEAQYLAVDNALDCLGFTLTMEVDQDGVRVYMDQSEAVVEK